LLFCDRNGSWHGVVALPPSCITRIPQQRREGTWQEGLLRLPAFSRPHRGHIQGYGLKSYRCACLICSQFIFPFISSLDTVHSLCQQTSCRCSCSICCTFIPCLDPSHSIDNLALVPVSVSVSRRIRLHTCVCQFCCLLSCQRMYSPVCRVSAHITSITFLVPWCTDLTVFVYIIVPGCGLGRMAM